MFELHFKGGTMVEYVKIAYKELPIIEEEKVSHEKVEETFLKYGYGVALVVNDKKQFIGYYSVNTWNGGGGGIITSTIF